MPLPGGSLFVQVLLVESRSYAGWPSAKHALRPPIGQLTSACRLAASCIPALIARTTTIQLYLLIIAAPVLSRDQTKEVKVN
jgi:hypothetical protein